MSYIDPQKSSLEIMLEDFMQAQSQTLDEILRLLDLLVDLMATHMNVSSINTSILQK